MKNSFAICETKQTSPLLEDNLTKSVPQDLTNYIINIIYIEQSNIFIYKCKRENYQKHNYLHWETNLFIILISLELWIIHGLKCRTEIIDLECGSNIYGEKKIPKVQSSAGHQHMELIMKYS
ncbi:Dynamin-related protein 3A [Dirofilaria immitis]